MARRRSTGTTAAVADENYAERRFRSLRWDHLAVLDSDAPLTPAEVVVVDRSAAIQAEHRRLRAADLTAVEQLQALESFLADRGWL